MSITIRCLVSFLFLLGIAVRPAVADPFAVIYAFHAEIGGYRPYRGLSADGDGNLYGATYFGGRGSNCGTIFSLTKVPGMDWAHKVLANVGLQDGECSPISRPLVVGDFVYGTTGQTFVASHGGSIFRVPKAGGGYRILHEFGEFSTPTGALLADADGTLHGTTPSGGHPGCDDDSGDDDYGTLYRIGPAGAGFRVSHFFLAKSGAYPENDPILGPDGAIYGEAYGQNARCPTRPSVIYRKAADGYSVLHTFASDESLTGGQLAVGPQGTLYGTSGAVAWALKPGPAGQPWTYTVLHHFDVKMEGYPFGVVRDASGNLYGLSSPKNPRDLQTLYRLSPPAAGSEWTFAALHTFRSRPEDFANGYSVNYELLLRGGVLYGSTQKGGEKSSKYENGGGVVFRYLLF